MAVVYNLCMDLFFILLGKLIPLYFIIGLGFFAGKFLHVQKESIARILIYILAPVVIFYGITQTKFESAFFSLPVFFFILGSVIGVLFLFLGNFLWPLDSTKNLLAFSSGTGNTGYFGIPVGLALFGDKALPLIVLSTLGFMLYENSVGFFLMTKGNHPGCEVLKKLAKLPTLYAFFFGILFHLLPIDLTTFNLDIFQYFKGAYSILGMMLIGIGLSSFSFHFWDRKYLVISFLAKFFVWPILILAAIYLDRNFFHFWNFEIYRVMVLMSVVPFAANTVAFATELRVHPEKAALAVFLSTMFAALYIPGVMVFVL